MKTAFKAYRGHVYHVVHETKTGSARKSAVTICGENFESGERSTHQPTCPHCIRLDNPFDLNMDDIGFLRSIVDLGKWKDAPRARSFHKLLERDFIDRDVRLTRRGDILADDWRLGPVPLPDEHGVVHTRSPLIGCAFCSAQIKLDAQDRMSMSRYEKLRKVEEITVVTCLTCLGK